jgi:hypothetical protein
MSGPPVPARVLRPVPAERLPLARAFAADPAPSPADLWWELVDPAAAPGEPATGVALTRSTSGGVVEVAALAAVATADDDPLPLLLHELVAALRRTDAAAVAVRCRRPDVRAALAAQEFEPAGDGRYLLSL